MNCLKNMDRIVLNNDLVMDMIKLYQFKGKDFYYEDITKKDRKQMIKDVVERDTFFFGKILDLKVSENKMRLIIKKDSEAKSRDEKILANSKRIFGIIQDKVNDFELLVNEIHDLSKLLYKGVEDIGFNKTPTTEKGILNNPRFLSKREDLEKLLETYVLRAKSKEYEMTHLITNFYVDFINLDIFTSNNTTIGLLLLYIFLFKERFNLFRYVSFFELYDDNKESFKQGLLQANFNWKDGYSQTMPLNKLIINLLLTGYTKVEMMIREYEFDKGVNKSDNIENTIMKLGDIFTKDEIRNIHPYVSDSTINRTLERLRGENKIRPNGKGRSATWVKLVTLEEFNPTTKQMSLFDLFDSKEYEDD